PAACASTATRSFRFSVSSAQRASVSASRQPGERPDPVACSASRSSRPGTSLINDLLQVERTWIVGDRGQARRDLIGRQPRLAQLLFDVVADGAARSRELARHRGFVLLQEMSGLRERELLHVIASKPETIATVEPRDGLGECLPDE